MKILLHSAPPTADTGYGVHTRNLIQRLRDDHEIAVHSVGGFEGMGINWQGINIYPSGAGKHGEQSIPYWFKKTDADVVFSHHDHWAMADTLQGIQSRGIPMVLYTILDHDLPGKRPPRSVVRANENSLRTVVMSEWAKSRVKNSRIGMDKISQIPHGVDTKKYAPVTGRISKEELKKDLGVPEDCFLFGMVAANYGPRKNIPQHMEAFKRFRDENDADDAYMYIHTHPTMGGGFNLHDVRESLNLDPEVCIFPDSHEMYHGIEDMVVIQLYNTFDVHMNVTQSESWGLTVTEAMSCGTPVIAANNSAMTEQFGVPYDTHVGRLSGYEVTDQGILVSRGAELWTQNASARRYTSYVEDIVGAMKYYYNNRDKIDEHGENAREWVVNNYDWDLVYNKYWKPFFDEVEEEVSGDYNKWYYQKREAETSSLAFQKEAEQIQLEIRGESVLDVGCGTGTLCEHLSEQGYEVVGVDAYDKAIRKTSDKGIEAYQRPATDLQFKDSAFDTVVSQHVLEHVEPDLKAVMEMARVAKSKVVIITPVDSVVSSDLDPTEVRRYNKDGIEDLKERVKYHTGLEMEYEKMTMNDSNANWKITIEV